jgi:arsenate reductase-like glutaredoxin family protein
MTTFKIIVKKHCFFCDKLKEWLADKKVNYKVLDYQDPKDFKDPLMKNPTFNSLYCDMSACVESLPLIVKNDKDFYYAEIWDLVKNELIEEKARKIFEI